MNNLSVEKQIDDEISVKLKKMRMVFFDFDGVFTDNRVIISENGEESVVCNRSDGIGLNMLRSFGLEMLVLSTETNSVVAARSEKLEISCIHGCENKLETMNSVLSEKGIGSSEASFVGNDVNDYACMTNVAIAVCVNDAFAEIKQISDIVLQRKGGDAAVREFCELVRLARTQSP